jgi:hypothetical protein
LMITEGEAVLWKTEKEVPIHFPLSFWIPLILGNLLMSHSFMVDAIHILPASTNVLNDLGTA